MNILVTGANGFLGQHLCRYLKDRYIVTGTGRGNSRMVLGEIAYHPSDITSPAEVAGVLELADPDVIIHAAAMSKPDECEKDKERCIAINVNGTANLIAAALKQTKTVHFIYVSTDFVFGEGGPHDETARPAPLNFYGESKLAAEKLMEESRLFYSIVRPVFMYGEVWEGMRPTFLHWVKQNLEEGRRIKVVSDQQRTPTYVGDICKGIESIIEKRAGGLFHLAGEEVLSPYDMAFAFAKQLGLDSSLIEAVTAETFNEPVQRAKNGGLIIEKAKAALGFTPIRFTDAMEMLRFQRITS